MADIGKPRRIIEVEPGDPATPAPPRREVPAPPAPPRTDPDPVPA